VDITPIEAFDNNARAKAIENASIVLATGAAGVELLTADQWQHNSSIEMIADANATPPLGIGGTDMMDKGNLRHGKIIWGAIGFGALKLALHRACIADYFKITSRFWMPKTSLSWLKKWLSYKFFLNEPFSKPNNLVVKKRCPKTFFKQA